LSKRNLASQLIKPRICANLKEKNYEFRKLREFIAPIFIIEQIGIPMDIGKIPKQEISAFGANVKI